MRHVEQLVLAERVREVQQILHSGVPATRRRASVRKCARVRCPCRHAGTFDKYGEAPRAAGARCDAAQDAAG
jgi:hypothetical protein